MLLIPIFSYNTVENCPKNDDKTAKCGAIRIQTEAEKAKST
jgi:hypothetical protein